MKVRDTLHGSDDGMVVNEPSSKRTLWNPPPTLFHVTDSPWSTVTAAGMNTLELVAVTV